MRTAASLALAASLIAGCGDDTVSGASRLQVRPARVAFTTSVSQSVAGGTILLRVSAFYQRAGGVTAIGTQVLRLSNDATQQLPLTLDLSGCLQDASRTGAGDDNSCVVLLTIEMLVDGKVVDVQQVSPFSVKGGTQTTLSQPVALQEIAQIVVNAPAANIVTPGQPARLVMPGSLQLGATLTDAGGQPVLGREIAWSSGNSAVANVSASGEVTAVGPGTVTLTATVGDRSGNISVRVVPPPNTLVLTSNGTSGNGVIRSEPAGIVCTISGTAVSGSCRADFAADAQVSLTASPAGTSQFRGWGGACGANPRTTCTLDMTQPRAVTTAFVEQRGLSLQGAGTGEGTITAAELGLSCSYNAGASSGGCSATLEEGARITLTASAAPLSRFAGWSGDCRNATGNSCTVTVNENRSAVAEFIGPVRVAVGSNGNGSGVVRASVGGIDCTLSGSSVTGTCSALVAEGTPVTLTATPSALHRFAGWSGVCAASSGATCQITANGAATAVARFVAPARLTVVGAGSGSGRVRSDVGDIDCAVNAGAASGSCTTVVLDGTAITLTATPTATDLFDGFGGDCSASATTCRLTVTDTRTVRAGFVPPPVATVTVSAPASSFIIGAPLQATVLLRDARGIELDGRVVTWSSSDVTIMRVSGSGLLTPVSAGSAVITATAEGKTGSLAVTVLPRPALSSVSPAAVDAVFADLPAVVTGNHLRANMVTSISGPLALQNVQLVDTTLFTGRFLVAGGQPQSVSSLSVTTNGGASNVLTIPVYTPGTAPLTLGVAYGGGGGSPYTIDCPTGTVGTALNVRSGTVVDQLQLVCRTVTGASRVFGTALFSGIAGGNGGSPSTLSCPAGSVATGLTGYIGNFGFGFNDNIALVCRSVVGYVEFTTGSVGTVFPNALFFKSVCPVGLALTGVQGGAGDNIDRSQIRCR